MFAQKESSRISRTLVVVGTFVAIGVTSGCAGWFKSHSSNSTEFAYVATGLGVSEYKILSNGQLDPIPPGPPVPINAVAIVTTKDNKFAYTANKNEGTVSQLSIGTDGHLSDVAAPVSSGTGTLAVAVTPDSKYVYALNAGDGTISEFSAAADGTLTPLSTATIPVAPDGDGLTITPNGNYLYATSYTSNKISAYSIGADGQLAALTVATYDATNPSQAAVSPDGTHLYVPLSADGVGQYSIGSDGALTPLSPPTVATVGLGNDAVAVTPDGHYCYVGVFNGGNPGSPVAEFSVGAGGGLTALDPSFVTAGNAPYFIAIDPTGRFAYVANSNDGTVSEYAARFDGQLISLTPAGVDTSGAFQIAFATK
ncbi:MAG TPA: beta-propeller fold lactonase family protein [Fimbriimonadaceae bacterium]|nr:beta-propeller fold lactonase family protein [Fimbriimonadaceae bacterium]